MGKKRRQRRRAAFLWLAVFFVPQYAAAQSGENVLIVVNGASPASNEIGDYYARKRQVPSTQLLRLHTSVTEEIPREVFENQIERPLAEWLTSQSLQDRILYIVLTKDVPIRITGTDGLQGTVASVDSELTLLYRKLCQITVPIAGSIKNPYFLNDAPIATAKPFTHRLHDLYLVTRLDGFSVADVKALIDRGAAPATEGRILLDERAELTESIGNKWLRRAASELQKIDGWHDRIVLETGAKVLSDEPAALGYYSWGSNDPLNFKRHLALRFVAGAIGATFVSTDARSFQEPPADWVPRGKNFAGSPQSLIADLIRDGITGIAGHVSEPYLNATIRPDILFPAYVSGMNLAEAFYLAMPFVGWQTIVVGDPLCAPFRHTPLSTSDIDPGIESTTTLPAILSVRRIVAIVATGVQPGAARLFVGGSARLARQDQAGAREAFEAATKLDPNFTRAHFALASLYESAAEWDAAIDRYRRILGRAPNSVIALNNLAYLLAVRKNAPSEALPLAERAYAAAQDNPTIADTLAWVQHLLGNDADAEPIIINVVKKLPDNADIHLHAAFILAATGKSSIASRELEAALKLNAQFDQRDDVRELRKRLSPPKLDDN